MKHRQFNNLILHLFCLFFLVAGSIKTFAENGSIRGRVVNAETLQPLAGANVFIEGTQKGAATDVDGNYFIPDLSAGSFIVTIQYIGYATLSKTDVIVRPGRITYCDAALTPQQLEAEAIVVQSGYFTEMLENTGSITQFNREEIRRSPGSAGDISRILMAMPSTAQVYDNANDLMVRGGSPMENGFYIDNIPVPNINHFPVQGSSGGPIGLLNVDFIENVSFYCDGFSPVYGDRLSSVVDIDFRDGNREQTDRQLDLNMGGFGAIAEGPLDADKGSWFVSARRSYLDLIVDAIGTGVAPRYGDVQGKVVYDVDAHNQLSLLNIFGTSEFASDKKKATENNQDSYGKTTVYQNTIGVNWRRLWKNKGYSNTSLSWSYIKNDRAFFATGDDRLMNDVVSLEGSVHLRNVNYYRLNANSRMEFGIEGSYETADYDYALGGYTNRFGSVIPPLILNDDINSLKTAAFFNYTWNYGNRFSLSWGWRGAYFSAGGNYHSSPRLSVTYRISDRFTLNGAYGEFYQQLPAFLMAQRNEYKHLKDPHAVHYIIGAEYLPAPDTRLTLEVYYKKYDGFPVSAADPAKFIVDDGRSMNFFRHYGALSDKGKARSRGVELLLQKKLAKDFYGLVSASYFRSHYRDFTGTWRNRIYDNRWLFSVIGGYKPDNRWEFSVRWNYAGGVPYTPLDLQQSAKYNTAIIDTRRINANRYPAYHSLNLRVDRRFYYDSVNLVTYLSIWNVYNRKNVALYYWNELEKQQDTLYQWSMIPIGGIELEF